MGEYFHISFTENYSSTEEHFIVNFVRINVRINKWIINEKFRFLKEYFIFIPTI